MIGDTRGDGVLISGATRTDSNDVYGVHVGNDKNGRQPLANAGDGVAVNGGGNPTTSACVRARRTPSPGQRWQRRQPVGPGDLDKNCVINNLDPELA